MIDYNRIFDLTKKLTVLFVEDDKDFREETYDILKTLFSTIDTAVNGKEALEKYLSYFSETAQYYDIVITDIKMPFMDGLALTKEIYKLNKLQHVIVISAHDESKYLLEFVNIGIEQFLLKPLDFDKIIEVIDTISKKIANLGIQQVDNKIVKFNDNFYWDIENKILHQNDKIISLTTREIDIMTLLVKNGNKISTYEEMFSMVWNDYDLASVGTLKHLISKLRKKIPNQKIENVCRLGYRLVY